MEAKRVENRSGGEKQWLTEKRDGALGTWRFWPIYCLLDSISIFLTLFSLVVLDRCDVPAACSILMAAEAKPQSTSREAGLDAIFEQASKRRILASLIRAMTVLQYVKMILMQGTSIVVLET